MLKNAEEFGADSEILNCLYDIIHKKNLIAHAVRNAPVLSSVLLQRFSEKDKQFLSADIAIKEKSLPRKRLQLDRWQHRLLEQTKDEQRQKSIIEASSIN